MLAFADRVRDFFFDDDDDYDEPTEMESRSCWVSINSLFHFITGGLLLGFGGTLLSQRVVLDFLESPYYIMAILMVAMGSCLVVSGIYGCMFVGNGSPVPLSLHAFMMICAVGIGAGFLGSIL
jgi:hypothetical protein